MAKNKSRPHVDRYADLAAQAHAADASPSRHSTDAIPNPIETAPSEGVDYYIGRVVLGTEAFVGTLHDRLPGLEIFEHEGCLVVPAVRRHSLRGASMLAVQSAVNAIHEQSPQSKDVRVIRTRGVSAYQRTGWVLTLCLTGRGGRSAAFLKADAHVAHDISAGGFYYSNTEGRPTLRIAEGDRSDIDQARRLLHEHDLVDSEITVTPIQVCKAPSKVA